MDFNLAGAMLRYSKIGIVMFIDFCFGVDNSNIQPIDISVPQENA